MTARPLRPAPEGGPDEGDLRSLEGGEGIQAVRMMADRILVRRPEEDGERRSRGGLLIPPNAASVSKRALWAEVVAVGPHVRNIEPGDRVLLLPDSGVEVEIRGDEYVLVREREVHAVATDREDGGTGLYL